MRILWIFLLVIYQWNCTRSADLPYETYYFLRVALINNRPPVAILFQSNLEGREIVEPNDHFTVEISTSSGQNEKMTAGRFKDIICTSNVKYTIRWKRHTEEQWHTMEETLPRAIEELSQKNLIIDQNQIRISGLNNTNGDAFYLDWNYFPEYNGSPNDLIKIQRITGLYSTGEIEKELYFNDNDDLILWPPRINPIDLHQAEYYTCLKPFNWSGLFQVKMSKSIPENLIVFQMSNFDFNVLKQLKNNANQAKNPLYMGQSTPFEYVKENNFGHVFSMYQYDVRIDKILPKENPVTYDLLYKGQAIDTQNIQIKSLVIRLWDNNANLIGAIRNFQFENPTDTLFFEDYLTSAFNQFSGKSCANIEPSYKVSVLVYYIDKLKNQERNYESSLFDYKLKNDHVNIDIQ
jgi:hypothetical protein